MACETVRIPKKERDREEREERRIWRERTWEGQGRRSACKLRR